MENKIKDYHLERVKEIKSKVDLKINEIGSLSVEIYRLEDLKNSARAEIEVLTKSSNDLQQEMFEEYGDITFDINTGEINKKQ